MPRIPVRNLPKNRDRRCWMKIFAPGGATLHVRVRNRMLPGIWEFELGRIDVETLEAEDNPIWPITAADHGVVRRGALCRSVLVRSQAARDLGTYWGTRQPQHRLPRK